MTFNIRYNNPSDKANWWEHRKPELKALILNYQPSVLGLQEALLDQVEYLDENLENYSYVGVGRDDGKTKGEYAPIFYDKTRMELLKFRNYWLSESPEKVSVGWDASMERIVTFASFIDKQSKENIYVFNAHFDHIGEVAQEKSAALIIELINELEIKDERIVVMGDLNCVSTSKPIQLLKQYLNDAYDVSDIEHTGPKGTFNRFEEKIIPTVRIDYILTKNLRLKSYHCIDDKRTNGLCISDHLPVLIYL